VARRGPWTKAPGVQDETAARARSGEGLPASADLAFLAASSPVGRRGEKGAATELAWRRAGAESALLLCLRTHPEVRIQLGARKAAARARILGEAERARVWQKLVSLAPGYARYEKSTRRVIPLIALSPVI
jgi:deazaflavin-dependent oxidoreductase (nitroreductase family)